MLVKAPLLAESVGAPVLPKKIRVAKLPSPSLRLSKPNNPMLEAALNEITPFGVKKGISNVEGRLAKIVSLANRRLAASQNNHQARFQIDAASGKAVVRLIDFNSGHVIREYSSEKVLENAAILQEAGRVRSVIG